VSRAYAQGVPMGSDLPGVPSEGGAPGFAVTALRDPGTTEHPGTPLQRIQIVKAWVGDDGVFHQAVHDVAGRRESEASVDPETCRTTGGGFESLCAVWRDPEFDPARSAFYYARVVENPSCRQSAWLCASLTADQRPAWCADASLPRVIQERAWSSPIWYTRAPH
jgi:hypothetical protein